MFAWRSGRVGTAIARSMSAPYSASVIEVQTPSISLCRDASTSVAMLSITLTLDFCVYYLRSSQSNRQQHAHRQWLLVARTGNPSKLQRIVDRRRVGVRNSRAALHID